MTFNWSAVLQSIRVGSKQAAIAGRRRCSDDSKTRQLCPSLACNKCSKIQRMKHLQHTLHDSLEP